MICPYTAWLVIHVLLPLHSSTAPIEGPKVHIFAIVTMMDIYRPSTRDSQRAFLQYQQQQPRYSHDRRVSQATSGATTAVQSQLSVSTPVYSDEKSVVEPPLPDPLRVQGSVNVVPGTYPLATVSPAHHHRNGEHQGYNWSQDSDLDPVPRYPGTPAAAPATLAVPPIEREKRLRPAGTICGVKKGPFLLLSAVAGLVLLAIGIGVGVGVGLAKKPTDSEIASGLSGPSTTMASVEAPATVYITTTISSIPTSTSSGASASATATGLGCPQSHGTQYTSNNNKKFIILCGVDYSDEKGEANDISNAKVKTFKDCLELCSKRKECTGAGWGFMDGDKAGEHACWMKHGLNGSHTAVPEWGFGVLLAE